jgi:hypothetical protein
MRHDPYLPQRRGAMNRFQELPGVVRRPLLACRQPGVLSPRVGRPFY